MTVPKKSDVNLANATRPDGNKTYENFIRQITEDGVCPFCQENLANYHKNPILKDGSYWVVTKSMYPYEGTKFHFLFIHKEHVTNSNDMSAESFAELKEHMDWLAQEFKVPAGTLMMRCGDTSLTGATVTHLHAHFIVADYDNPERKPIMARVG